MKEIPLKTVQRESEVISPVKMLKTFILTVLVSSIGSKYYLVETEGGKT